MATMVLGAVGTAYLGPVGGFVGAAVGSYIDNAFLFPAIFGRQSITGPRLDDIPIQTASEGSPMKWCLGPRNRVAGTWVWSPKKPDGRVAFIEVKTTKKPKQGPRSSSYTYFIHAAVSINDSWQRPINRILKVFADSRLIFDAATQDPIAEDEHTVEYGANAFFDGMTVYKGTATQPIDPLIEASEGTGRVPRFKKTAFVVFTKHSITEFGHIPQWNFIVEEVADKSVADAIDDIATRAGLEAGQIDVTRVPGCLRGYVVNGPQPGNMVMDNVLMAYGVSVQRSGSVVRFFARGREVPIVVSAADLAAHEPGSSVARLMKVSDCDASELPREVTVTFSDADFDMQQAAKSSRRVNLESDVVLSMTFPLTFKGSEAKNIAFRWAWVSEAECPRVELSLPPSYATLEEGDALEVTAADGEVWSVRADEVSRGANFLVEVKGTAFQSHLYSQIVAPVAGGTGQTPYSPPEVELLAYDGPALQEGQVEVAGYYFAGCAVDPDARWRGASLFQSADGTTYAQAGAIPTEAVMGTAAGALAPASDLVWDALNTVVVDLLEGELTGASEQEVLDGANAALLGDEVVAFRTAEQLGPSRYRLGTLLRGLRDTAAGALTHAAGERFLLLDPARVGFKDLSASSSGTLHLKAPAAGASVASAEALEFEYAAGTLKPFGPAEVVLERDLPAAGDVTVSWVRRSRAFVGPYGGAPFSSGETPESYEVDLAAGGSTAPVLRTKVVSAATSCTYTAAEQTADGVVSGSRITARIYQMSTIVGRGRPAEGTVE